MAQGPKEMHDCPKEHNPDYLHGGDTVIDGTGNQDLIGGSMNDDTIIAGDGNDIILADTSSTNPNVPLEYRAELNNLPFNSNNINYTVNGVPQTNGLPLSSDGTATVLLDPAVVNGQDVTIVATGIVSNINYEFYDSVPSGFTVDNIPTTGADFTGSTDNLDVNGLARSLTGSGETYAVRYISQIHIDEAGSYTFSTRSDDGSALFIDGVEVVSNDGLHGARTRDGDIVLGPGTYEIEILFFENRGGDVLEVEVSGPDTNGQSVDILSSGQVGDELTVTQTVSPADIEISGLLPGLEYEFFDIVPSGFTVDNIPDENPDFTGVADDLNVRDLALELTNSHDTYSVRYNGEIYIDEAGTYDFSTNSDDGSALIIDGQIVVINDGLHAPESQDGQIFLDSGIHTIEILFFENRGGDVLSVDFLGPDTNGQTIDLLSSPNVGHLSNIETSDGGDDLIDGGAGDDVIEGGAGNDAIIGGEGADEIDGGTGDRDIVAFEASATGVVVNLESGTGQGGDAEGDTYDNVEFIHGSTHDDVLTGDENTNRLVGHNGNDELYGGAGNDTLLGGRGADHLDGGAGDRDVAEYDWSTEGVVVNLETGVGSGGFAEGDTLTGIEYIYGSYYADILTGDANTNRLVGDKGDDQLYGGEGKDYLIGGEGADHLDGGANSGDTAVYRDAEAGVGVDLANGGFAGEANGDTYVSIEYVDGSDFDDIIIGDDAQNRLVGQGGADTINGGGGNDYIIGMQDDDILTGGVGDDVFLYKDLFGDDVITDFEAGAGRTDRIWLDLEGIEDISDLTITDTANGALIDVDGYGTILLENVAASDLASDDFIF